MLFALPNLLTLSRIAAIPLLIGLFFVETTWAPWVTCVAFVAAAATDYFDGYIARQRKVVSAFGRLMDPIADKMLVAAVLFALVGFDRLQGVTMLPAIIILLREVLISGLREFLAGSKSAGLPVSRLAKWKTTVQMTAIGFLIVGDSGPELLHVSEIGIAGLWFAALLTLITGWDYVRAGVGQIAMAEYGTPPPPEPRSFTKPPANAVQQP